jgi:tRNA uracil 4-sulfurtransferase
MVGIFMTEEKIEPDFQILRERRNALKNDTENEDSSVSDSSHLGTEVLANVVLVRYGELALKSSGIRDWYEKLLMKNIAAMLESREIPYSQIRREWGRIY